MDIFAHGLWGGILGKAVRRFSPAAKEPRISPWWTGVWATFPDLLAFVPLAFIIVTNLIFDSLDGNPVRFLYSLGHSAVVWSVIFLLVWTMLRRPPLEFLGWLSHIVIDIFTHPADRYPTPFLWPLQETAFDGTRWATPEFMLINYALILAALYFLRDHQNIKDSLRTISKPRKIFLILLFLSSLTAFIR